MYDIFENDIQPRYIPLILFTVITIIYGYKADSQQRKYLFQIISNLQIISSES